MKQPYNGNDLIRWLVIFADFVILNSVFFIYENFELTELPQIFHSATKITIFAANASLLVSQMMFSTIIHRRRITFAHVLGRTFKLAFFTFVISYISIRFIYIGGGIYNMLKVCIILGLSFYGALIIARLLELLLLRFLRSKGRNSRTVVFIGNDPAILEMYESLIQDPALGYKIYGYYANHKIPGAPKDLQYLGNLESLNAKMSATQNNTINGTKNAFDEAFCCLSHEQSDEIVRIMQFCDKNVIHFYYLPRQFGNYRLHLESREFMGHNVYVNRIEPLLSITNRAVKRLFDIVVSGIVCVCLLPFIPIIALIIKIQSPGPVFFKQERTGQNGETFNCLKFRSMHVNKDADTLQATKNDPRKFAFGNFMRKTNIDEFPQFFNVLKGDMSIVGPRPHMLHHTEVYGKMIDKYMVRHFSKPGITGWAQVTGCRGETKELWQMEERIKKDIWYIEHWSLWLDIKIMFLTAKSILFPDKNAY